MSEYLTVRQVRDMFGVSSKTVRRWISAGLLASRKHRVTGTLFVPKADVERVIAEDLKPWAPGKRPITIKDAPDVGAGNEQKETESMAQEKKAAKKEQAQEHEVEETETRERAPPARRQERAPPKKKSGGFGTIFDDDEDSDDGDE